MSRQVLIDATQLSGQSSHSGIGSYVRHLLGSLGSRPELSVSALATSDAVLPAGVDRRVVRRRLRDGRPAVWEHETRRTLELRSISAGVFHNPNPHAPLVAAHPWVQTLHDVIPLVYDDPALAGMKRRFARFGRRYQRADAVIAVSAHAAAEGVRHLGIDPDRITVVHHGVGPEFSPGADPPAEPPYISVVAEYSRRKGFELAAEVIAGLAEAGHPHRLVLAGRVQEWLREEFQTLMAGVRRPDRVETAGFVADLPAFYRGATVHLVTSRYEGFGLPALEAMACGVPVVAFDNSSLPEVIGDGGVLVPDGDVAAMTAAVHSLITDPGRRSEVAAAGLERARRFTWEASAAAHAEVYAALC